MYIRTYAHMQVEAWISDMLVATDERYRDPTNLKG